MNPVEARALALVGARFRLHGRCPESGLDCVGVAADALEVSAPRGYAMRGGHADEIGRLIEEAGLAPVAEERPGDLMLFRVGLAQLHLAIKTRAGFVHADAGLRRVVERPGVSEWEVVGLWRRSY